MRHKLPFYRNQNKQNYSFAVHVYGWIFIYKSPQMHKYSYLFSLGQSQKSIRLPLSLHTIDISFDKSAIFHFAVVASLVVFFLSAASNILGVWLLLVSLSPVRFPARMKNSFTMRYLYLCDSNRSTVAVASHYVLYGFGVKVNWVELD